VRKHFVQDNISADEADGGGSDRLQTAGALRASPGLMSFGNSHNFEFSPFHGVDTSREARSVPRRYRKVETPGQDYSFKVFCLYFSCRLQSSGISSVLMLSDKFVLQKSSPHHCRGFK
jgi:hypothetical protein